MYKDMYMCFTVGSVLRLMTVHVPTRIAYVSRFVRSSIEIRLDAAALRGECMVDGVGKDWGAICFDTELPLVQRTLDLKFYL
jgi:hypothetical protein